MFLIILSALKNSSSEFRGTPEGVSSQINVIHSCDESLRGLSGRTSRVITIDQYA